MSKVIYYIMSKHNNSFLIGSSVNYPRRFRQHLSNLRNDRHGNPHLQAIFNKYGENNLWFGILEIVDDNKDLLKTEQEWIDTFWSSGCLLNINRLANKPIGMVGRKHSEESKQRMSIVSQGKKCPWNIERNKKYRNGLGRKRPDVAERNKARM